MKHAKIMKKVLLAAGISLLLASAICFAGCRDENMRNETTDQSQGTDLAQTVKDAAETAADKISEGASKIAENAREDISSAGEKISEGISGANDALEDGATRVSEAVSDLADGTETTAPNADD